MTRLLVQLGRHVLRGAKLRVIDLALFEPAGQAKVDQLEIALFIDEYILEFEVTVSDSLIV